MSGFYRLPHRLRLWWWQRRPDREDLAEWALLVLTVGALWCVNSGETWRPWGIGLGVLSSPFWIYFTARDNRRFMCAASIAAAVAWLRGGWAVVFGG